MDAWQQRAIGRTRTRHEDAIREAADKAQDYARYVLRDLEHGRTSSYAANLLDCAQAVVTRSAQLDALAEVGKILKAEG